jgi:hypothetical protein
MPDIDSHNVLKERNFNAQPPFMLQPQSMQHTPTPSLLSCRMRIFQYRIIQLQEGKGHKIQARATSVEKSRIIKCN